MFASAYRQGDRQIRQTERQAISTELGYLYRSSMLALDQSVTIEPALLAERPPSEALETIRLSANHKKRGLDLIESFILDFICSGTVIRFQREPIPLLLDNGCRLLT